MLKEGDKVKNFYTIEILLEVYMGEEVMREDKIILNHPDLQKEVYLDAVKNEINNKLKTFIQNRHLGNQPNGTYRYIFTGFPSLNFEGFFALENNRRVINLVDDYQTEQLFDGEGWTVLFEENYDN